jgi:hypothetical protein
MTGWLPGGSSPRYFYLMEGTHLRDPHAGLTWGRWRHFYGWLGKALCMRWSVLASTWGLRWKSLNSYSGPAQAGDRTWPFQLQFPGCRIAMPKPGVQKPNLGQIHKQPSWVTPWQARVRSASLALTVYGIFGCQASWWSGAKVGRKTTVFSGFSFLSVTFLLKISF